MGARATCPNCKSVLTCGCQLKTASNGTRVCNNCIQSYELKLQQWQPIVQSTIQPK